MINYFPRFETTHLNDKIRSLQSGSFLDIPDGKVHYELAGSETGQPVVLVHGFSIPYYLWDPTFDALVKAGFRVLRFDLFGRGYSDRLNTSYNLDLFCRQLFDLLNALNIHQPVHLAGVSMGGPICTHFAVYHPEKVRSVCLIDPAGFPPPSTVYELLLRVPLVGEFIMTFQNRQFVIAGLEIDFYRPDCFPEYVEQYMPQLRIKGSVRALLSTLRCGVLDDLTDLYQELGKTGCPVQLFWGKGDQTFSFETSQRVLACIPHAEFHPIDEARHVPHYEYPDLVNPLIIDFFSRSHE